MPKRHLAPLLVLLLLAGCGDDDPSNPDGGDDNSRPNATISSPNQSATFQDDVAILFQGGATDAEDGILTGGALVWRSNLSGQIGTGQAFTTNALVIGEHEISLIATDEDGGRDTAKVNITIEDDAAPTAPGRPD